MVGQDIDEESNVPQFITTNHTRRKRGGWRAVKFILANETFEKVGSMSLIANITVYLQSKYNMSGLLVVNVVNIWSGICNFLTMPGALLSDTYLGRFGTLLLGSIVSILGMGTITLGSAISKLRPPPCDPSAESCVPPSSLHLAVLFIGLGLLAMGSGCLRPCNVAFGADQFDIRTEKGRAAYSRFYNWWYFSFTLALLFTLTLVVYIQTNISWTVGLLIPTASFAISSIIFVSGFRTYIYKKPTGSIYVDLARVVVAAYRKRKVTLEDNDENHHNFYDPPSNTEESLVPRLSRTNRLKFLDKASMICQPDELNRVGIAKNNWRLCSVQQVEQLKSLIAILPVWLSGILAFMVMDNQNTLGIMQAVQANRKIGSHFTIPPAWINFWGMVALTLWILSYERVWLPLARILLKKEDVRLSIKTRIKIGIVMSILSMVIAAAVEPKRRNMALKSKSFTSPLSVLYLGPQVVFSGLTEAFAAVTILEFFTTQMPESMRSMAGSLFFISLSMASYLSTATVNIIYQLTRDFDGGAWLGGRDLNKGKLENYYAIIVVIEVINFLYFTLFASKFVLIDTSKSNINSTEVVSSNTTTDAHTSVE